MPRRQRGAGHKERSGIAKPNSSRMSQGMESSSNTTSEAMTALSIQFGGMGSSNYLPVEGHRASWKPKSYGTMSEPVIVEDPKKVVKQATETENSSSGLGKLLRANLLENFIVDNSTYSHAKVRATFYPKFENEKSDQEVRTRMIEMVSKGLATLEVSLKHSGSLFMYAGHEGGAYAKNSFGNVYTAVGVFVLGRMFCEAWGIEANRKQADFNDFLEKNRMCVSMELVTAVLGDHGQRPRDDYVVVTAVTELGCGKPKFYSTPEIIAFCRKWRLPTNHVWLFSTRKSVTSFFAAYDALCEEGTASPVCKALDEVADISIPGSKDHVKVQGEILEGLVARIVSCESSKHMEQVLRDLPPPAVDEASIDLGPSLRELCAANRSDEKQQIKALLESVGNSFCPDYVDWFGSEGTDLHSRTADKAVISKFLQAHPADFATTKLQEMIRLMKEKHFPAAFKCYHNFHRLDSVSSDNLYFKMVIHVYSDSVFKRYQKVMRDKPELWPLYRGFFVDLNLVKGKKEKVAEITKSGNAIVHDANNSSVESSKDGLADEDANLMIKLKFLTYKLRTFLIRNGLSILFKDGPTAYKTYYRRQMNIWNTSPRKQQELTKMLDEWAVYIRRKCGNKPLKSSTYLSEAEPFLEQYAKRSPQNQALIGSAGDFVRSEDFMALVEGGRDEEGDLKREDEVATPASVKNSIVKDDGLIVFFPGIPGCAKSALCAEILKAEGGLGDERPVHSLMGDLIKGKYWDKVDEQRRRKPNSIVLADKNAPNEEVWMRIENMCRATNSSAVPVIPDSEGTESNPFSLDAFAVFIFRVLHRANHPGNLDKNSPNAGYVLLMFYNLYNGKSRAEFEGELIERFGALVKMPLLKPDREPLPDSVKSVLEEGLNLYKLHQKRHGRLDSTKGSYAGDWKKWERKLREVLFSNAEYLDSIQVPFEFAVSQVFEQLKAVLKGDYKSPSTEKRKLGNIIFAAIDLPANDIECLLAKLSKINPKLEKFLGEADTENNIMRAHLTLAHKRAHGVTAVANYGIFVNREIPVEVTALLFSDKMAALEACPGSVDGEKISSMNQWPHVTLWTAPGVAAKEANTLPQLHSEGKATRVEIDPPITITGVMQFH